jgi:hypothetical protein
LVKIATLITSADYRASKTKAVIKYCICELSARRYHVRLDAGTRSAILLPEKYYQLKRTDFEYYASVLGASLVTVGMFSLSQRASRLDLRNFTQLYLWSDAHLLARYVIDDLELPHYGYDVIQHGDFPVDDVNVPAPIEMEWLDTRAKVYWVWSERSVEILGKTSTAGGIKVIGRPPPRMRARVSGFGFGCRGPEYFVSDLRYLLSVFTKPCELAVYFHPTCSIHKRLLFLFLLRIKGFRVRAGETGTVTIAFASLSRSFLTEAELAGAARLAPPTPA